jgi:hypothetical protein
LLGISDRTEPYWTEERIPARILKRSEPENLLGHLRDGAAD